MNAKPVLPFTGLVIVAALTSLTTAVFADAVIPAVVTTSPETFAAVRLRIAAGDAAFQPALERLLEESAKALKATPASVMDKPETLPGVDMHDYVSYGPYYWPNPDTASHLPFVRHDGKRNREQMAKGDSPRFEKTIGAVNTLGLAYGLTGRDEFATHAATLLRVWFLDPKTRMNPNFTHAQAVPGANAGRGTGLIDFASMAHLIDTLALLQESSAWTANDRKQMTDWLTEYADWLATNKEAAAERAARNNHGTWFDTQEVSLLLYLGKTQNAREICERAKVRIGTQIEPDGRQPLEEARADGFGYSVFNVDALCLLASLAGRVNVDLWHYQSPDGRGVHKAIEYLSAYADPATKWPHNQMNVAKPTALVASLQWAVAIYKEEAFRTALQKLPREEVERSRLRLMIGK